jgi:hypothetical protein
MRGLALALALALPAVGAAAHPMPNSTVVVTSGAGGVEVSVAIPISELSAALGHPAGDAAELARYLGDHAAVTGPDGRPWPAEVKAVGVDDSDHPALAAILVFTPPTGASGKGVALRYDAVTHRVASHYVLVYRRNGDELTPLGRLQAPATTLKLP